MRVRNTTREKESSPLQMSAMIDVVFLLLIFFVMTFQITAVEGDVPIDAAQATSAAGGDPPREFQLYVHLRADRDGSLENVQLDGRRLETVSELRSAIDSLVDTVSPDDCHVILRSDPDLQYQHAMDAITAIRGGPEGKAGIQNIRFIDAK